MGDGKDLTLEGLGQIARLFLTGWSVAKIALAMHKSCKAVSKHRQDVQTYLSSAKVQVKEWKWRSMGGA